MIERASSMSESSRITARHRSASRLPGSTSMILRYHCSASSCLLESWSAAASRNMARGRAGSAGASRSSALAKWDAARSWLPSFWKTSASFEWNAASESRSAIAASRCATAASYRSCRIAINPRRWCTSAMPENALAQPRHACSASASAPSRCSRRAFASSRVDLRSSKKRRRR